MIAPAKQLIAVSLHASGSILLTSKYDERVIQFARSCGGIFDAATNGWLIDALPQKAHRLCNLQLDGVHVEVSPKVREIAQRLFDDAPIDYMSQPSLRVADSWRHQAGAYNFKCTHPGALWAMGMGCVSADTEFLSPAGWKRIDQWNGEMVAQYDPTSGLATFVEPDEYIKLPCTEMWEFKHTRGLSQCLSDEHRVLWFDHKRAIRVNTADEIARGVRGTAKPRFQTAFAMGDGSGLGLDENQIRLQVAVMADGHFPANCSTRRCVLRIKKPRKIERLKQLLGDREYHLRVEPDGFHCFHFDAPLREKSYAGHWWQADYEDKLTICDEVLKWDGTEETGDFYTRDKDSADFIQYCFASTERRASLLRQHRADGTIDYVVHVAGGGRTSNYVNLARKNGNIRRVPTPDGFKYCFAVPWTFLVLRRDGCVFVTGNTGKSKPAVEYICNQGFRYTLILCPTSVRGVWRREFEKWAPLPVQVLVLDRQRWTIPRKVEEAEKFLRLCAANRQPAVIVINYESACNKQAGKKSFASWSLAKSWDCVVLDESHRVGNATSQVSKYVARLGRKAAERLCLTGTPLSHSPLSIFGQARFLDPSYFGESWPSFRGHYAVTGPFGADHVVGYKNLDELSLVMSRFTYQVGSEVLDLPPTLHVDVPVELSPSATKLYGELESEMIALVGDEVVTASNGLVKLLRLQQLTSGHLPLEDGTVECTGREKEDALAALLEDIPTRDPNNPDGPSLDPVVVCCVFKEDLARVRAVAERLSLRYGEVSGQARDLTPHAQMFPETDVLGVQIQSGGVGIDLTRARYAVLYSVGYSLSNYDQFLARTHRPGQTRPVTYYHLVAKGTVDETIYKALSKRRNLIEAVLERLGKNFSESLATT